MGEIRYGREKKIDDNNDFIDFRRCVAERSHVVFRFVWLDYFCRYFEIRLKNVSGGEKKQMNPETKLQNQIIVALCERGCFAVNHTVGDFYTKYGAIVSVGVPGEADIWGHRPDDGKAFYVEVKLPGEKPRKDQLDFIEAMRNTGAIAGWATSIPEAIKIVFEEEGI